MIKKCVRCGAEFEARSPNAKYCLDCRVDVQCEHQKRYRRKHPEVYREHSRRWRTEHLDYYREYSRRWRKEHPEQAREHSRRSRERQKLKLIREILSAAKELTDRD